ncbi:SHOCT domain-containing protein, partial [Lactobacillus helveticus]
TLKLLEQVKKLKELLDQGILTEEEFQAKKKQILKI